MPSNLTAVPFYRCVLSVVFCNAEMTSTVQVPCAFKQGNDAMWPGTRDIIWKPFFGVQEHCRMRVGMACTEVPIACDDMVK